MVPEPVRTVLHKGYFSLNRKTRIVADPRTRHLAAMLKSWFAPSTGYELTIASKKPGRNFIRLAVDTSLNMNPWRPGTSFPSKRCTPTTRSHPNRTRPNSCTEYTPTTEQAEYMAYPRACALAEVAWSALNKKDYTRFTSALSTHLRRLD